MTRASAQTGVILAERLGLPHATIIMDVQGRSPPTLRVKRELEGGWFQWVSMPLPAVLTIQSGINQLRYATLKGIMAAKKKEIKAVPLAADDAPKTKGIVALLRAGKDEENSAHRRRAGRGREGARTSASRGSACYFFFFFFFFF